VTVRRFLGPILAAVAFGPIAVFGLVRLGLLPLEGTFESPPTHVVVVGGAAMAATAVAALMIALARREHDPRGGLVGVGFLCMAGLLVIHGLATPGFILDEYGRNATVGLAGGLAVPTGGVVLALAVLVPARLVEAPRVIARCAAAAAAALVLLGVAGLAHPQLVPEVPVTATPWAYTLLLPAVLLYGWIARRTWHTFQLTRRAGDLAVVLGLIWLASSIPLYLLSPVWSWMFWTSHALEGGGFLAVAGAVARDLTLRTPTLALPRRTTAHDLLASEAALLGGYVTSLTATMHLRDPSTLAHSRRVAFLAVGTGERLGLPPAALRRLAVAGLLHDIGKLGIPAEILNKPGRLTDEEYETIKTHPRAGADLLALLGSFDEEIPIVLHHHERVDGRGYPHAISGGAIPVEARIMAVCDVYDALTSRRAYREPWAPERAVELIVSESGAAFDPDCVDALLTVLEAGSRLDRAA
jgi:HD-GYP domain-containing protein (c-di-GMP phosphodiesterase class II)